jgi:hypothetical protein
MSALTEFEQFLTDRNMSVLEISVKACVRYAIVRNATMGIPMSAEHIRRIRHATWELTGVAYTGALPVYADVPTEQFPAPASRGAGLSEHGDALSACNEGVVL